MHKFWRPAVGVWQRSRIRRLLLVEVAVLAAVVYVGTTVLPAAHAGEESAAQTFLNSFAKAEEQSMTALLSTRVSMEYKDIHLQNILEFVNDFWRTNIIVDERVVLPPRSGGRHPESYPFKYVTDGILESVELEDEPLHTVLQSLCDSLGLAYVVEPGYVWVSTPHRIEQEVRPQRPKRYAKYEIEKALAQTVALKFKSTHLSEILDFISHTWRINIALDQRVVAPAPRDAPPSLATRKRPPILAAPVPQWEHDVATHGYVRYVMLKNLELRDCLRGVLRPLNLTFKVVANRVIWVTSHENARERSFARPEISTTRAQIAQELTKPVSLDETELFAVDLLSLLAERTGLNIQVDRRVEWRRKDRLVHGPVATRELPAYILLGALLRMCRLDCEVHEGRIMVSTSARLGKGNLDPSFFERVHERTDPLPSFLPTHAEGRGNRLQDALASWAASQAVQYLQEQTEERFDADLGLIAVRRVKAKVQAHIYSDGSLRWYDQGDTFDGWELQEIDSDGCTVILYDVRAGLHARLDCE